MTIDVDQNDELGKQQLPQDAADQIKFSGESRRQFATSGLAVSGVILTLVSRPVLGATVCVSPSGFISGNTSTHGDLPVCDGRSAGFYLDPSRNLDLSAQFRTMFPTASESAYKNKALSFILTTPWTTNPQNLSVPTQNLLKHLVVAILNARSGKTPFLTEATIKSIFDEWQAIGTFSPTAGVAWDASQIINYLSQTQNT